MRWWRRILDTVFGRLAAVFGGVAPTEKPRSLEEVWYCAGCDGAVPFDPDARGAGSDFPYCADCRVREAEREKRPARPHWKQCNHCGYSHEEPIGDGCPVRTYEGRAWESPDDWKRTDDGDPGPAQRGADEAGPEPEPAPKPESRPGQSMADDVLDRGLCIACGRLVPRDALIEHTIESRGDRFWGLCRDCGPDAAVGVRGGWYLETMDEAGHLRRLAIHTLPFRVGRRQGLALTLTANSVSEDHAEIYETKSGLRLRDLGSKNGTFVNSSRIEDVPLQEGDIIHFAQCEFRLGRQGGPVEAYCLGCGLPCALEDAYLSEEGGREFLWGTCERCARDSRERRGYCHVCRRVVPCHEIGTGLLTRLVCDRCKAPLAPLQKEQQRRGWDDRGGRVPLVKKCDCCGKVHEGPWGATWCPNPPPRPERFYIPDEFLRRYRAARQKQEPPEAGPEETVSPEQVSPPRPAETMHEFWARRRWQDYLDDLDQEIRAWLDRLLKSLT